MYNLQASGIESLSVYEKIDHIFLFLLHNLSIRYILLFYFLTMKESGYISGMLVYDITFLSFLHGSRFTFPWSMICLLSMVTIQEEVSQEFRHMNQRHVRDVFFLSYLTDPSRVFAQNHPSPSKLYTWNKGFV